MEHVHWLAPSSSQSYPDALLRVVYRPGERRLNVHVELDVGRLGRGGPLVSCELQQMNSRRSSPNFGQTPLFSGK